MSQAETTQVHTRLLKCSLVVEDARAYWQRTAVAGASVTPALAFDEYWFGARSLDTVNGTTTDANRFFGARVPRWTRLNRGEQVWAS